jgi:hypothetical protein
MDSKSFLRRTVLIALVSALSTFGSVASAHGGGHGSGGSSGSGGGHGSSGGHSSSASNGGHSSSGFSSGHSSSGSSSGHSSSGFSSGHSSSGSSSGHSSSGSSSGHSSSVSKGGHSGGDPSNPAAAVGGRAISDNSGHSRTVRSRPEPVNRQFSTGGGHGDWREAEETVDWQRYNRRRLFGFIWY